MAALAILAFGVLSEPALAVPNCDQNYRRAIQKAETAGDFESADALRSLKPIDILKITDWDTVICRVWLPSDLSAWDKPGLSVGGLEPDSEQPFFASVTIDDRTVTGIIAATDIRTVVNRVDLAEHLTVTPTDLPAIAYYRIDEDTLNLLHARRTNLLVWLWLEFVGFRFYLLPIALWAAFLFAWFGGGQSADKIAEEFERARREGYEGIFWIGGMRWRLKDGAFWRVLSVIRRTNEDDVIERFDRAARLEREAEGGWPQLGCAIGFPLLADFVLFSSDDPTQVAVCRVLGAVFLFFSLWGIATIYFQRRGHQGVYGAMVLDAPPDVMRLEDIRRQKIHGDARPNSEAEAVAATSGVVRRSSVHDQEF